MKDTKGPLMRQLSEDEELEKLRREALESLKNNSISHPINKVIGTRSQANSSSGIQKFRHNGTHPISFTKNLKKGPTTSNLITIPTVPLEEVKLESKVSQEKNTVKDKFSRHVDSSSSETDDDLDTSSQNSKNNLSPEEEEESVVEDTQKSSDSKEEQPTHISSDSEEISDKEDQDRLSPQDFESDSDSETSDRCWKRAPRSRSTSEKSSEPLPSRTSCQNSNRRFKHDIPYRTLNTSSHKLPSSIVRPTGTSSFKMPFTSRYRRGVSHQASSNGLTLASRRKSQQHNLRSEPKWRTRAPYCFPY